MKQNGYQLVNETLQSPEDFEKEQEAEFKRRKQSRQYFRSSYRHPINQLKGSVRYIKNHNLFTGEKK